MSTANRDALRDKIDNQVGAYVEAALTVEETETKAREDKLQEQITLLTNKNLALSARITDMEMLISNQNLDDKYALTKAKLIRLMKDMGYYD